MRRFFYLTFFVLIAAGSQNKAAAQPSQSYAAYIIPRVVYVGDPAVLILPLPGAVANSAPAVSLDLDSPYFPQDANFDFHRVTLERGTSGGRLLIEFTAFATGHHDLPAIEIGGERFTGLSVSINSILDNRSTPTLSGMAPSLAMPGTALMLYGTIAGLVFMMLVALWFTIKGRHYFNGWSEKFKRWQLFVSMRSMEKRLQKAVLRGENKRAILDILSEKFRIFLSFFTGNNCRAMTAREFEKLYIPEKLPPIDFLGSFFRRCDELRFAGTDIDQEDIFTLLADLRFYLSEVESIKKEEKAS